MGRAFGICGWSGSGKTSLLEEIVPRLVARGLRVAVVKHDVHGIDADDRGKDSDRLFRSGADVLLEGPDSSRFASHDGDAPGPRGGGWTALVDVYDLVLLEGHKRAAIPKVWLLAADGGSIPREVPNVVAALPPGPERADRLLAILTGFLGRGCRLGSSASEEFP